MWPLWAAVIECIAWGQMHRASWCTLSSMRTFFPSLDHLLTKMFPWSCSHAVHSLPQDKIRLWSRSGSSNTSLFRLIISETLSFPDMADCLSWQFSGALQSTCLLTQPLPALRSPSSSFLNTSDCGLISSDCLLPINVRQTTKTQSSVVSSAQTWCALTQSVAHSMDEVKTRVPRPDSHLSTLFLSVRVHHLDENVYPLNQPAMHVSSKLCVTLETLHDANSATDCIWLRKWNAFYRFWCSNKSVAEGRSRRSEWLSPHSGAWEPDTLSLGFTPTHYSDSEQEGLGAYHHVTSVPWAHLIKW